jgi:hypothetical protein
VQHVSSVRLDATRILLILILAASQVRIFPNFNLACKLKFFLILILAASQVKISRDHPKHSMSVSPPKTSPSFSAADPDSHTGSVSLALQ